MTVEMLASKILCFFFHQVNIIIEQIELKEKYKQIVIKCYRKCKQTEIYMYLVYIFTFF